MRIQPTIDQHLRLRTQIASGKIDGIEYCVTQNADNQAFFVEFTEADKTTHIMFATPLREMVQEAYTFYRQQRSK